MLKIPKHIKLTLNETETIFLLDINSSIVCQETNEGEAVLLDNITYDNILKNQRRRITSIGVQTTPVLKKTRSSEPRHYSFQDDETFASNWEMYDTYLLETNSDRKTIKQWDPHKLCTGTETKESGDGEELEKLASNDRFFVAALVIERLLANNCYNTEQKKLRGLLQEKSAGLYNYKLSLLWTFSNDDTKHRCVTGLSLNPINEDIIAVGYGKYHYIDRKDTGAVMVWNIKNPKQPERCYKFVHPVTCLEFSKTQPNLLAVGFYNGTVRIVDVNQRHLQVVITDPTMSLEPAWDIVWFEKNQKEYFLVGYGDGRVCKYHLSDIAFECQELMRCDKVEGRMRGLNPLRMSEGSEASSLRFTGAQKLCIYSEDSAQYLVASSDGVIRKCYTNYCTHHIAMFKAHEGSVSNMKFSPFLPKIYASCGVDFKICIWFEGICEPLLISSVCMEPVLDFDWSSSHSTIFVSLHGMEIYLWDLQRKFHLPQSQTKSPTNSKNTKCQFTASGRCLLVGDIDGNLHIFSVSGLPAPPFFQENLFKTSIKNILVSNKELTKTLDKTKWV